MALPFTRERTYVANTTPTIRAPDLNLLQDYEIHAFQGTKSIKRIQVDGVSDAATTVANGAIAVGGADAASAALPCALTPLGHIFHEHVLAGCGFFDAAGAIQANSRAINIESVTVAANLYVITMTFDAPNTDANRVHAYAIARNGTGPRSPQITNITRAGNKAVVTVGFFDAAGAAQTTAFYVQVWAI